MNNPDSVMVRHIPMDPNYKDPLDFQIEKYINIIDFHRKNSSKNKAMLSFKYDELTLKVTFIQIIIILFSTAISFLETIKSYYDISENLFNVIIVTLSTSVALIMAVYRFLKYEEKKENVKNAIQDHVFIINKFRKIYSQIESVKEKPDYYDRFYKIVDNFENETFDNYISIRENFDTIFSFRDSIYYKNKYKKNLLKLEKANNEIEMIDDYKREDIVYKEASLLEKVFCCISHKIDYDAFIENGKAKRKVENEEKEKKKEEREKREKEERERLLEIQNENNESFLVERNKVLEMQLVELQNRLNDMYRNRNEMRANVYARAVPRTVSPVPRTVVPVPQTITPPPPVHVEVQRRSVHFEPSDDNTSDVTQVVYTGDSNSVSSKISNEEVKPETKEAYELQINRLKEELKRLTCEMGEATSANLSEIYELRKELTNKDAERVRFQRDRDIMEAEMEELRRRHEDTYERCAAAPVARNNDENEALKRIIDDCRMDLERKEAELAALRCELAKQMEERAESERVQRREHSAMMDDLNHLEEQNAVMRAKLIDLQEILCQKNIRIEELTKKIEDFEKIEKKGIVEEKEENEILEEKQEKEEKENLSIMINEIDTDSDSNPSSPGTLV